MVIKFFELIKISKATTASDSFGQSHRAMSYNNYANISNDAIERFAKKKQNEENKQNHTSIDRYILRERLMRL